ncbi:UNVERIFIED_CONTAM: hypothetical protein RMT77_010272 [Armadillidium vulgare]
MTKLSAFEKMFPGLKDAMYQVSCEEEIDQIDPYCSTSSPPVTTCEKEHVLICIRIKIKDRIGVILLDPGYHVVKPITVMMDRLYPHSGKILIGQKDSVTKYYSYEYHNNPAFVLWKVTEESTALSEKFSLVHVNRPFLSAVDISERRNLVYPFKSLLHRNSKGELTAGLYFKIRTFETTKIVMFYIDDQQERKEARIPLEFFLSPSSEEKDSNYDFYEEFVKQVEERSYYGVNIRRDLKLVATLIDNKSFLFEFFKLNADIDKISKDN